MAAGAPRPAPAARAIERARAAVEEEHQERHPYILGGGDYRPDHDSPVTTVMVRGAPQVGCDCVGLVCHALELPRRRPGFNVGPWSVVTGYINTDSAIQDAQHHRDLFDLVTTPRPGDLVCWPSIYDGELAAAPATRRRTPPRRRIGHIGLIEEVPAEWDPAAPQFDLLTVIQCGSKHRPAIHRSSGASWANRQRTIWGERPEWGSVLLRPRQLAA